jgi:PAS domain S-box-containing protein
MMRVLNFQRDLRLQLLAFYLLLVLPVLVILGIFDIYTGQQIRAEVTSSDLSLARAIAKEVDLNLQNSLNAVRQLSTVQAVVDADPGGMDTVFSLVSRSRLDVNLVYRLDADGIMLYHYPTGPVTTVGKDFSFREYYRRARVSTRPILSEGRISPTTNQAVATAVMPLLSADGHFSGLVATNIHLENLSATLREIISAHKPEEGFEIFILDHTAHIIAHADPQYLLFPARDVMPDIYRKAMAGESSSEVLDSPAGNEHLYTYAPIPSVGWAVVVHRPTSAAFAQQITVHRITLTAFGFFAVIGFLFWLVLSRRVILPVERLSQISETISENRAVSPEQQAELTSMAARPDQLGNLINSLVRMQASIVARMTEQATLLETSKAVVSSLDTTTVLNIILEQVQRLMNVQMTSILALDEETGVFKVRASRGFSRSFTESLTIEPNDPLSVTMRAIRSGNPEQISDTESDPTYITFREEARSEGYRSLLAVPLKTQFHSPAALIVFHPNAHVFTETEQQLLVSFANHATMAIENAARYSRSDKRLKEQTRRLEALVQSLQEGLILGDLSGNVVYTNRRVSELAELSPADLSGASVSNVLSRIIGHAREPEKVHRELEKALAKTVEGSLEIPILLAGREVFLRLHTFDVTDPRGVSIGQGVILRDITADISLDRVKSGMITTVSHELRTPLAAIKGYASTLLADDVEWDSSSQREFLQIISSESDRLSELVDNLLDLSRIEANRLTLRRIECDVDELVHRAATRGNLQPAHRLEVDIEPGLPPVFADPPRLETILRNLIENSAKYAGPDAQIRIGVSRHGERIIFRVEDNGPGISSEESRQIFDAFHRGNNRLSRTASGAGLGLAICLGFVQAHGGDIWVEPRVVGSCIAFSIPVEGHRLPV